jgi:hypothetical protein
LNPLIRLYPSEIFISCFSKNFLVSNCLLLLDFAAYKKIKKLDISFGYSPKYISRKKKEKKIVQKDVYWFLPQKS